MGRSLDTDGLKELLQANLNHPRWEDIATRCLACGNCTMVCPTCFCTTVEDLSSLDGTQRRTGEEVGFLLHAGLLLRSRRQLCRTSGAARYRQWMTHKLANWIDQFGTPGCVGCGRCITWCPVGIDITEEAAAIKAGQSVKEERDGGA